MKLSKKLTAIFAPIASVSIVAPIATSCGNNNFEIKFGDSVNCLDKEKQHTDIAKYHKIKDVHNSSKLLVEVWEKPEISVSDANSSKYKTLRSVYGDFIASWSFKNDNGFCLDCKLEEVTTPTKFVTFNFQAKGQEWYIAADLGVNDFDYQNIGGQMMLQVNWPGITAPILSYRYHNAKAK